MSKKVIIALVILVLGAYGTSLIFKDIFKVPRPCIMYNTCPDVDNPYDIPSSHTTVVFSVAMFLSFVLKRRDIQIALFSFSVLVGIERIITHYHSLLGVISGALLGCLIGGVWYYLVIRLNKT